MFSVHILDYFGEVCPKISNVRIHRGGEYNHINGYYSKVAGSKAPLFRATFESKNANVKAPPFRAGIVRIFFTEIFYPRGGLFIFFQRVDAVP